MAEQTLPAAPSELYDEDLCVLAVRADKLTRGQAQAFFASEAGIGFTEIRVRKAAYRYRQEYADEMEADGITEPYDGWPWWECGPGEKGIEYWQRVDPHVS